MAVQDFQVFLNDVRGAKSAIVVRAALPEQRSCLKHNVELMQS